MARWANSVIFALQQNNGVNRGKEGYCRVS
jgi:hypothetical protein